MALAKRNYSMDDMEEQDLATAPSLDFPSLSTEKYLTPKDGGKYMLFLTNIRKSALPTECPFCGSTNDMICSGYTNPRVIHDVIRNNYRVDIAIQPPRVLCKSCGQRFVPHIKGIDDKHSMTTRLLEFLRTECFLQSHTELADRCGVSVETIRNIMDLEIQKYENDRKANPLLAPRVLGIDEKHINHIMRGTLVDVERGLLLDMLEDNKQETMKNAIKQLKDWDARIEVVTTDMSNSYLKWLPDLLPNATVVIDKFHVIQDIQRRITSTKKQLYEYRKNIVFNLLTDPQEKVHQMGLLRKIADNGRLFNYSIETIVRDTNSHKAQTLASVIDEFPEFKLLRKLYYLIELMYTKETRAEAELLWDEWVALLPPADNKQYKEWCELYDVESPLFNEFRSFVREGFQSFKPYILNYFNPRCRYTNAATEGLNNMIGSINRVGNGYSFRFLRAKCLYASLIHERIVYGIDVKTIKKWKPTLSFSTSFDWKTDKGTYEDVKVSCFTQSASSLGIKPLNVFDNNEYMMNMLYASVIGEEIIEPQFKPIAIDERALADYYECVNTCKQI